MIKNNFTVQQQTDLAQFEVLTIQNFLTENFANDIYSCLSDQVNWGLAAIIDGKSELFLHTDDVNKLDLQIQNKIIEESQKDEFQFIYNSYMMVTAYKQKRNPGLFLHQVLEWLNSAPVFKYFESLTQSKIARISAQATRYLPGHHLTEHSDIHSGEKRMFAYVLSLTKTWKPEWGGLLHLIDKEGQISRTIIPEYNRLSIFKVPQNHFVSMVSPLAKCERLSITGWIQA